MDMSESDFQARIIDTARVAGWKVWYQPDWVYRLIVRDMGRRRIRRDWPDAGFPDLWLVHPERQRLLVFECKSAKGSARPAQKEWVAALVAAGVDARVIKPKNLAEVEAALLGAD